MVLLLNQILAKMLIINLFIKSDYQNLKRKFPKCSVDSSFCSKVEDKGPPFVYKRCELKCSHSVEGTED